MVIVAAAGGIPEGGLIGLLVGGIVGLAALIRWLVTRAVEGADAETKRLRTELVDERAARRAAEAKSTEAQIESARLEAKHSSVVTERDALASEVERLRTQIASMPAQVIDHRPEEDSR